MSLLWASLELRGSEYLHGSARLFHDESKFFPERLVVAGQQAAASVELHGLSFAQHDGDPVRLLGIDVPGGRGAATSMAWRL